MFDQPPPSEGLRSDLGPHRADPSRSEAKGNPYNGYSWAERMAKYEEMKGQAQAPPSRQRFAPVARLLVSFGSSVLTKSLRVNEKRCKGRL